MEDLATACVAKLDDRVRRADLVSHYERLRRSDHKTIARLVSDPRLSLLLDSLERLFAATSPEEVPSDAIKYGEALFFYFALSASVAAGIPSRFSVPLAAGNVWPLLGSAAELTVPYTSRVDAVTVKPDGELECCCDGCALREWTSSQGIVLAVAPTFLEPPSDLPGIRLAALEGERLMSWRDTFLRATEILSHDQDALHTTQLLGHFVVPIEPTHASEHCSVSFLSRSGALFMSEAPMPEIIAEAIVHETDHQVFYLVDRETRIWSHSSDPYTPRYRSPWREDARPLDGLLRGISAFTRVAEFWLTIRAKGYVDNREWILSRAALSISQCQDALQTLAAFAELTAFGEQLVSSLNERTHVANTILAQSPTASAHRAAAIGQVEKKRSLWRSRYGVTSDECRPA